MWKLIRIIKSIPVQVKRLGKWVVLGYDPWHLWSLDNAAAKFLGKRLEGFRDHFRSLPMDPEGEGLTTFDYEVWFAMIDKMAQTMRFLEEDAIWKADRLEYINEGLELFGAYFMDLWD